MKIARTLWLACMVVASTVRCADTNPHVVAQFAAGFAPVGHTVSVFGVFKDGRMSSSHWAALSARLAPALGSDACENGYDTITSSNPPAARAIDQYAMSEGPDDTLLAKVAPSASSGDLILVVGIAGKMPTPATHHSGAGAPSASASATGSPHMGGYGRHRGSYATMGNTPREETTSASDTLDLSASFYSVRQKGFVALIELKYGGSSIDEALDQFAQLLSQKLPTLHCVGWSWDAKLDAADFSAGASASSAIEH